MGGGGGGGGACHEKSIYKEELAKKEGDLASQRRFCF